MLSYSARSFTKSFKGKHFLHAADSVNFGSTILLVLAIGLALAFEFVNGFHDTANAVATVIYTHSLKPVVAVVWSGLCNLTGVLASNGAVAFSIVALLPVELVLNVGSGAGFAMVFSLLLSAIIWNLGTWYLGLPASSSHTLVGSIMGVGLANSMLAPGHVFGEGVNWAKAGDVFSSLIVSPIVGFVGAGLLLLLAKALIRRPELFRPPEKEQPPPSWIRGLLILTCTGVSYFHGSNDGQKGMGLLVLILVGILPGSYALNPSTKQEDIQKIVAMAQQAGPIFERHRDQSGNVTGQISTGDLSDFLKTKSTATPRTYDAASGKNQDIIKELSNRSSYAGLSVEEKRRFRSDIYLMSESINKLVKTKKITDANEVKVLAQYSSALSKETKYIPDWVKIAVACALGFGTMVGWKRIVVTVGERIGKEHLNYGQGASAEVIAMTTIGLADRFGLPVSTTHVLSSGIAGTMAANRSGLQAETLRNILLAWVLTLPVCVLLGAGLFSASFYVIFHILGVR
ncbi:MAG: inorganic phosphate transporter [Acidobacteriaceae bacterium]|nr:inorganic phosphate transporter [Acidobacteriaceae bacterium]